MNTERHRCPSCDERAGVPVVYGLPTPDLLDDPGVDIRGCVVDHNSPDWRRHSCGHEWAAG